jgi:hypothetical protein
MTLRQSKNLPNGEVQTGRPKKKKKAKRVKSKFKSMLIIFFDLKGIVHKELVLASQAVNLYASVTFYGDCLKVCEDFALNFGDERSGCCIRTTHHLIISSSPEKFLLKTT